MCCFSRPVQSVSTTNIFARPTGGGRQFIVYSMTVKAQEELAMVLPLPVKLPAQEKDVTFVDLSGYPDFFSDMDSGFAPPPIPAGVMTKSSRSAAPERKLEVVKVGSFEASFVPALADFSRLDERFRISDKAWKRLPGYANYGFAVFKLKPGNLKIHPMALSFPRRDLKKIFFPTVHIHDGEAHDKAEFDHQLYCQPSDEEQLTLREWEESEQQARAFVKMGKAKGLVIPTQHCYKRPLSGMLPNRDTLVSVAA